MLAYSGTLSIGVDYSEEHFDRVIGIYSGSLGLHADTLVQGLLRCRKLRKTEHMFFVKTQENTIDFNLLTPITCHESLRISLPENAILADSTNIMNGLKFSLLARVNLMYRYGHDWIFQCMKSIGFSFEYIDEVLLPEANKMKDVKHMHARETI